MRAGEVGVSDAPVRAADGVRAAESTGDAGFTDEKHAAGDSCSPSPPPARLARCSVRCRCPCVGAGAWWTVVETLGAWSQDRSDDHPGAACDPFSSRSPANRHAPPRHAGQIRRRPGVVLGARFRTSGAHLVRHGEIATFLGYPTYGHGVFENRCGIRTTVPLLSAFAVVCAAECGAGALLWHQRRAGAALALVLLPAETVFWVGFSLPYGPVAAAARTALVLRYRRRVPGRARKLA